MNPSNQHADRTLTSRNELLTLLETAMLSGAYRYARQISLTWLAYYPGDLPVGLKYGQLLLKTGQNSQAVKHLSELCLADPEYLEAWYLMGFALKEKSISTAASEKAFPLADCQSSIFALGGEIIPSTPLPSWATGVLKCRQALARGEIELAEEHLHQVLVVDPLPPLVGVTHLHLMRASQLPSQAVQNLADFYHQRFKSTIAPVMFLADALMDGGEPERAVSLLHQGATLDVTRQVADRVWGKQHPYIDIWPEKLEAPIAIPIPAEVAAHFGWNRLPEEASESTYVSAPLQQEASSQQFGRDEVVIKKNTLTPPSVIRLGEPDQLVSAAVKARAINNAGSGASESLRSVQNELDKVATKLGVKALVHKDGRFPYYVIFTTKSGLEKQYGKQQKKEIEEEMKRLIRSMNSRPDWGAIMVYADDPDSMAAFDLNPVSPEDPWSLKLALHDLDRALAHKGAMIGALLIVGGPEVVPYHNLPNPVDDLDLEVPSDNPYATRDENYFVPEWPVGRLPGGSQNDPAQLVQSLQKITAYHDQLARRRSWFQRMWDRFRVNRLFASNGKKSSWGYTAAIWRRASLSVFRPIGAPHTLFVSPPVQADNAGINEGKNGLSSSVRLGYFNLHGLQDSSNWYGQRDPSEPTEFPDYPVALRPEDIKNGGSAPEVVFSEACYGANIIEKQTDDAIALKFLSSGSQSVVGSTCTSYGSITTPLIAADLLGHAFWKFLRDGLPAGEALRRAKIYLAQEMHRRQGYLDGEDQKTLISFLLLGDPLTHIAMNSADAKLIMRSIDAPSNVNTVCDRHGNCSNEIGNPPHSLQNKPPIPSKTMAQVKAIVEEYLPGMKDADISYTRSHATCAGNGHTCPTSTRGSISKTGRNAEHNIITLSKHVKKSLSPSGEVQTHHHYVRLKIDDQGKVIKMCVSR
jgi:tetratricopeptide (TPR) repeat protein